MEKLRQIHTRYSRVMTLVLLDIIMVNIVVLGAMWVRLEFSFRLLEESGFVEGYLKVAPVYTVVCLVIFTFFRLYRSLWEYASIDELRYIILAAVAAARSTFSKPTPVSRSSESTSSPSARAR